MKLLLTSAGWWKNPKIGKDLLKLVGKSFDKVKVFAVITPDKNYKRNKYIRRAMKIGILSDNIKFFQLDRRIKKGDLSGIDAIFVFGGNTFDYLKRIKKTGFDKEIKKFVKNGGVYVGFSAGSYVACPTIKHAYWKNPDRNSVGLKNLKGLNLVPFIVTAHFEEKYRVSVEKGAEEIKLPVIAMTDKQAVLVNGRTVKIIGGAKINVFNFTKNQIKGRSINLVV